MSPLWGFSLSLLSLSLSLSLSLDALIDESRDEAIDRLASDANESHLDK